MWSSVFKSLITGYFVISLNTLAMVHTLGESDLKSIIVFTLNLGIVLIFPIYCYRFLKSNVKDLEKQEFKDKYGPLYETVYIHEKKQT